MRNEMRMLAAVFVLGSLAKAADNDEQLDDGKNRSLGKAAMEAIGSDDTELFGALLKAGLHVNQPIDPDGNDIALHICALGKKAAMVKFLLEHGADRLQRDTEDERAIDKLRDLSPGEAAPLFELLKREPSDYDKQLLMDIPVPVWREVLGPPVCPDDPLAPPKADAPSSPLLTFISINGKDPAPEMKLAMDVHHLGWLPKSQSETAAPEKGEDSHSQYRDKQSHQRGEREDITLVPTSSKHFKKNEQDLFITQLRTQDLPAYEFKLRVHTGEALSGHGQSGYIVLVAGYWIRVGVAGWDE